MMDFVIGTLFGVVMLIVSNRVLPWFKQRCSVTIANVGSVFIGIIIAVIVDTLVCRIAGLSVLGGINWALGVAGGIVLYYIAVRILPQDYQDIAIPSRLKITVTCLNAGSALSIVCGLLVLTIGSGRIPDLRDGMPGMGMLYSSFLGDIRSSAIIMGLLLIFVIAPLIRHIALALTSLRYWAWLTGLILSGLMIFNGWHSPYVFTVLGGLSLWGLLDKETMAAFLPRSAN